MRSLKVSFVYKVNVQLIMSVEMELRPLWHNGVSTLEILDHEPCRFLGTPLMKTNIRIKECKEISDAE